MSNVKEYIKNPHRFFSLLASKGFFRAMPDEKYLKKMFRATMGCEPDLDEPKTYNEKLQWLKLHDRNPLYTKLVDKYLVREYIAEKIGKEYLIPLLSVWDRAEDIDFDSLPNEFVLKCNHNSGKGMFICKDKSALTKNDLEKIRKGLSKGLEEDYYFFTREWPYKDVPRKIVAEKYMVDESGYELKDYKFFCFDGKVKALFVASDRGNEKTETKFDFFDTNFVRLPFTNGHPNSDRPINRPENFDKMLEISEVLSEGFPHIRVDLYDINGRIYFGELTFYHWSGFTPFEPKEWDYKFGQWLSLPKNC